MITAEDITKEYDDAVRTLARWHADLAGADFRAYSFDDPARRVVRLVEVSADFPPAGQALPVGFGTSADFLYRSEVILLTPDEWEQVQRGELELPEGWGLADRREVGLQ